MTSKTPSKHAAAKAAQRTLATNPPKLKLSHGQRDAIVSRSKKR